MIETPCPQCGQKTYHPDPPPRSADEVREFARRWDGRVVETTLRSTTPAPGEGCGRRARRRARLEGQGA